MIEKLTSFWRVLSTEKPIDIPIIQRDYAQGRESQSALRSRFLDSLSKALAGESSVPLVLDFVFGSNINEKFQPIDGQQRLTTLWLLHWYVALKAEKLDDENVIKYLKNFRYETRVSSREFCEQLCKPDNFRNKADLQHYGIVNFITNQPWFYKGWSRDPTISGMLRVLGSSGKKIEALDGVKYESKVTDNLENLFSEVIDFKSYWKKLTDDNCPILFYYLSMEDYGLYDDLYVKINSRGKQLTSFENFKADLISFLEDKKNSDIRWASLSDPKNGLPSKMDIEWTDLFWKNRDENQNIDEIYFVFFNRYFLNELILNNAFNNKKTTGEDRDESLKDYLPNPYSGLKPYKFESSSPETFGKLITILKNFIESSKSFSKPNELIKDWTGTSFDFIPDPRKETDSFTLLDQIRFFAICKYFSEGQGNKTSFKQWMRVIRNLISGRDLSGRYIIRSTSAVISVIRSLERLNSHQIYRSLCDQSMQTYDSSKELTDWDYRFNEEILKAKQILDDNRLTLRKRNLSSDETWEETIEAAEDYSFFEGSICFLFHDENGEVNWHDFDNKLKWVKTHFKKQVENSNNLEISSLKEPFNKNALLLKGLISRFDREQFRDVAYWNYRVFNNHANTWRYFLRNKKIAGPVHQLLMSGDKPEVQKNYENSSDYFEKIIHQLTADKLSDSRAEDTLLDFVSKRIPYSWIRTTWRGHLAIYPSGKGVFLDARNRDVFINNGLRTNGEKFKLIHQGKDYDNDPQINNTTFLFGPEIRFIYNDRKYSWDEDNYIYLLENTTDGNLKKKIREEAESNPDKHYFRVNTKEKNGVEKTADKIFQELMALSTVE